MNKAFSFLLLLWSVTLPCLAQEGPAYIEPAGGGKFRFYYNEQYFLVDKNCEFLSRTRVSALTAERKFSGPFTDSDTAGVTVLTGNYLEGKKEGTFRSFYTSGFLRWQGDFRADLPAGTWNYYYPDGTPKMILEYNGGRARILNSWNEKGKQVVKNGEGNFFLRDLQFGYNQTGHEALLYRGRVREGLPHGQWMVHYQFPGGDTEEMGTVAFRNGRTTGATSIRFAESEFFANAENFTGKNCVVDDQINFSEYLRNLLNLRFDFSDLAPGDVPAVVDVTLLVTSEGQPKNVALKTPMEKKLQSQLKELLYSVSYWVPSQKDGQVIDDALTLSMEVLRGDDGTLTFGYPKITRAAGY